MNRIVFMFPGQGTQYYHMGKELYNCNSIFRKWMSQLNAIVYQNIGISITDELYDESKKKSDTFEKLTYTHPAIFMVEYSLTRVLLENGLEPDCLLGASLGEVTSAVIAGVISVEQALEGLLKSVEIVARNCNFGSMIAILNNPELYDQANSVFCDSELAAVNYGSHFIISGEKNKLLGIENYLSSKDIIFQRIPVKYGFHSSNIDPIEKEYKELLETFVFREPSIPIISCCTQGYVKEFTADHFWNVYRQPIYFQQTIQNVEKDHQCIYLDLGPSGTLANFVKCNLSNNSMSQYFSILSPYCQDTKKLKMIEETFCKKV